MLGSKKLYAVLGILVVATTAITFTAAQAISSAPKVGSCYNYKWSDVSAPFAVKGPVTCTSLHTAETYRVGMWPSDAAPDTMDGQAAWSIANSICQPMVGKSKTFNYWAWYSPNPTEWAEGKRWVRCDAMKTTNAASPYTFATFRKKMLDIK